MRARVVVAAVVLWALPLASWAQSGQAPAGPGEPPGPGEPRGEAGRMVDAYVLSNLQESLGLSDEQFVKLLPLVKRLQADRRDAMQRRRRAVGEMRRLLKSGAATEAQVVEKLNELKAVEAQERSRATLEAIDAQLTPLQQAKFRVFEADVGQKLRELMNQLRRQNAGRPGRERPRGSPEP